MMETATSYWNEFPTKLLNCCTDSRQENMDMVENEEKLNNNLTQVKRVNINVYLYIILINLIEYRGIKLQENYIY